MIDDYLASSRRHSMYLRSWLVDVASELESQHPFGNDLTA